MNHVFQKFVETLSRCPDAAALGNAMEEIAVAFDLHRFAYLVSRRNNHDSARLISNYPTEWTNRYLANGYERIDPVITRVRLNSRAFKWGDDLWAARLLDRESQLMDEAAVFGIRCGFTFPVHDGNSRFAAITFAADQCPAKFRHCYEKHHEILHLLAIVFHSEAWRTLAQKQNVAGVLLSQREFECLEWAAKGKSAWDTGQIVGISRRTVAFHLENAKMKLGVRTIPQAVALLTASKLRRC